ncbi:unnamed protein product [Sphagnum balticum]
MECFFMVRYGKLRSYTQAIKKFKEELLWTNYLEFLMYLWWNAKTNSLRYEFFLLYINELKEVMCRAKGEIKYIVFDKTITFLQKKLTKFDREIEKQEKNKKKLHFLPLLSQTSHASIATHNIHCAEELQHSSVVTLPKI